GKGGWEGAGAVGRGRERLGGGRGGRQGPEGGQGRAAKVSRREESPETMIVSPGLIRVSSVAYSKASPGDFTPSTVTPYRARICVSPSVNPCVSFGGRILTMVKPSSISM